MANTSSKKNCLSFGGALIAKISRMHRRLYNRYLRAAHLSPNVNAPQIRKLAYRFRQDLPKTVREIESDNFHRLLTTRKIVLVADVHCQNDAQTGFLNLLKKSHAAKDKHRQVIVLETFRSDHQQYLDLFLRDSIDERALLEQCEYDKTWGFPWENYAPILAYAKANKIPVYGMNSPPKFKTSRDKHFANILAEIHTIHRSSTLFCLVGEYHLGSKQLPKFINANPILKKARYARILRDVEKYYFDNLKNGSLKPNHKPILRLDADTFCVLDSSPWTKWRLVTNWEEYNFHGETHSVNAFSHADYAEQQCELDVEHQIVDLMAELSKVAGISLRELSISQILIRREIDSDTIRHSSPKRILNAKEVLTLLQRVDKKGFAVVPTSGTVLLQRYSIENICQIAGSLLCFLQQHDVTRREFSEMDDKLTKAGDLACRLLAYVESDKNNPKNKQLISENDLAIIFRDQNMKNKITTRPAQKIKSRDEAA